jgi:hypothetical protein
MTLFVANLHSMGRPLNPDRDFERKMSYWFSVEGIQREKMI